MMADTNKPSGNSPQRKLIFSLLIGGVAAFITLFGVSTLLTSEWLSGLSKASGVAIMVGSFYVLMGGGVVVGALRPTTGAKILNVEDVEELIELQPSLVNSGLSLMAWGVALIAVALAAPEGPLAVVYGLTVASILVVVGSWFAWKSYNSSDELMHAVNAEGTRLSFILVFAVMGGAAIGEHMGLVEGLRPIDTLTLFYVLPLAASFVVTGRRGLLKPK